MKAPLSKLRNGWTDRPKEGPLEALVPKLPHPEGLFEDLNQEHVVASRLDPLEQVPPTESSSRDLPNT